MPQIRCPYCGATVNLENRKETDFTIILKSLESRARSFSELLKITGLPRKTLNIRLKELCGMEAVTKNKLYYLNGACPKKEWQKKILQRDSILSNKRKILAFLVIMCIGLPAAGNFVLAMFFSPPPPEPKPLGNLIVTVNVGEVSDVYGWQIGLRFDTENLKVVSAMPGDFLGDPVGGTSLSDHVENAGDTLFYRIIVNDTLVLCQTLKGSRPSVTGSGSLAIVEFEYYSTPYENPYLVFNEPPCDTMLLRMDASEIPIDKNTVTLQFVP
ncbi:hypothetical protein HXY33_03540 [Candidatus Bathyarchaeota archaeon]|nr:hypothetical protein [Candidatus Bathyarchaeota archaeon]